MSLRIKNNHDGYETVIRVLNKDNSESSVYIVPSLFEDSTWDIAKKYTEDNDVLKYLQNREKVELNKPF